VKLIGCCSNYGIRSKLLGEMVVFQEDVANVLISFLRLILAPTDFLMGVLVKTKIIDATNWKNYRLSVKPPFLKTATELCESCLASYINLRACGCE